MAGRWWIGGALGIGLLFALVLATWPGDEADEAPGALLPAVTEPAFRVTVTATVGTRAGSGPLLGEAVGWTLMVGGQDDPLRSIDLDTGTLQVRSFDLGPLFLSGDFMVYRGFDGALYHAPIGIFEGPTGTRFNPLTGPATVAPAGDGTAWLTWPDSFGGQRWHLVDLADDVVVRDISTPPVAVLPGGLGAGGPEVIGSEAGGVFELQADGGYRQVLDGELIAAGNGRALVRQCDRELQCESGWYATATWAPLDLPAPAADLRFGRLFADGSLLAATTLRPALGAGLYEVETGQILRSLGPAPLEEVSVSPDGRWLVRRLLGRVQLVDVRTGNATDVPDLEVTQGEAIVWIPNG